MKIAIDVMSAERGPDVVIEGCEKAQEEISDLELVLVGPYGKLIQYDLNDDKEISIVDAQKVLRSDDGMISGVLKKRRSSLVRIAKLINDGEADAGVSFTDTKWIVAIASKYLKLPYISRTPLAIKVPSERERGYTILLDVGATTECKAKHLLEFGILGYFYAKHLGIENPKIGLLSNGTEEDKGNDLVKKAGKAYRDYVKKNEDFNYCGKVEAWSIFEGKEPDVIVMDGYTGNVELKLMEGEARCFLRKLYSVCMRQGLSEEGSKNIVNSLGEVIDPDRYGGAFVLGAKPFIKGHGNSNADSIKTAIKHAVYACSHTFDEELEKAIRLTKYL